MWSYIESRPRLARVKNPPWIVMVYQAKKRDKTSLKRDISSQNLYNYFCLICFFLILFKVILFFATVLVFAVSVFALLPLWSRMLNPRHSLLVKYDKDENLFIDAIKVKENFVGREVWHHNLVHLTQYVEIELLLQI